jgi:hypothetical protein
MRNFILPRLSHILFIAVFSGALLTGPRMLNTDGDLGRHLTLGNYILSTRQIPTRDLLSFTRADQPRPPYEWLADVLFSLVYRALNLDGVVLLTAFIIAAAFLAVYSDCVGRSEAPILALILVVWAVLASSLHWLTRPHVFSFLLLAIWIKWLEKIPLQEGIALGKYPLLMLLWANIHGGFIFGFLAWLAYLGGWGWQLLRHAAAGTAGRNLLIVGGTSLIASILTPDLWHNWEAVLNNRSAYILNHTAETMPTDFSTPEVWPFLGILALSVFLGLVGRSRVRPGQALLLMGLGVMSLAMARNIPLFVIAAAPILADWTRAPLEKAGPWIKLEEGIKRIESQLRGSVWPALGVLSAIGFFVYFQAKTGATLFGFSPQVFPVQASDWIETHPMQGAMFNDFNWGGYLLYRLWPYQRVFIDSQSDYYGEGFTRQYEGIIRGEEDWEAELSRYHVNWIIIPREAGLAGAAGSSAGWQQVYEDPLTVIFVRR